ncbi:DinB family protein [Kordia sp.]|uniref:DinB family protein n=1 Tax=Kordia sp. TaxID=1965332 RepID=UPI003D2AF9B6
MKSSLLQLYTRELDRFASEIELYEHEVSLWKLAMNISNSSGSLCLHLVGNLHHFIGKHLGNTDYVRQRDAEFSTTDVSKAILLQEIDVAKQMVITTLTNLPEGKLQENYPIEKNGETVTTEYMLLHLFWHLSYHVGQINYHRRLLDS